MQFLEEAGFCNVRAEDRTVQFIEVIEAELKRAEAIKDEFTEVSMCILAEFIFGSHVYKPHVMEWLLLAIIQIEVIVALWLKKM